MTDKMPAIDFAVEVYNHDGSLYTTVSDGYGAKTLDRADDPQLFDNLLAYERVVIDFNNKARPLEERITARLEWHLDQNEADHAEAKAEAGAEQEPPPVEEFFGTPDTDVFDTHQDAV